MFKNLQKKKRRRKKTMNRFIEEDRILLKTELSDYIIIASNTCTFEYYGHWL